MREDTERQSAESGSVVRTRRVQVTNSSKSVAFCLCLLAGVTLGGCALTIEANPPSEDASTPTPDANVADGGSAEDAATTADVQRPDATPADSGTTVETDAARRPVLVVSLSQPQTARQGQDVPFRYITITANESVEILHHRITVVSEGEPDNTRFIGSRGTRYFGDLKLQDLPTGATFIGPQAVVAETQNTAHVDMPTYGTMMRAGETRHLVATMDVSAHEDSRGELIGHAYSVMYIDGRGTEVFRDGDVIRAADGRTVHPEEIEGNQDANARPVTIVATWPNLRGCNPVNYFENPRGIVCTAGCYYDSEGFPVDIDPPFAANFCIRLCSVSGQLLAPQLTNGNACDW